MQPKRQSDGKEGLRDSVFTAIKGYPNNERISMSPMKCNITRTHSLPKHPKQAVIMQQSFNRGSTSSLSKKDLTFSVENNENRSLKSANSSKVSSMESITSRLPMICVSPPEEDVFEPTVPIVPAAQNVDEKTRTEWLSKVRKGDLDGVEKMLNEQEGLVNYVPPHHYNYAAIHVATLASNHKLLHLLKSKGADVNLQTGLGYSALHLAAQHNAKNIQKDTINVLIKIGVNPAAKDHRGHTYHDYLPKKTAIEEETPLRAVNSTVLREKRPLSQCSLDSTLATNESRLSRTGSFRNTIKKIIRRRSPSPF